MGVGATAIAVAGVAISAAGTIMSGISQSNAASYQAQVAQNNATIADQNANFAIETGAVKAQAESLRGAQRQGAIKAAEAASGVDVNTGSAKDVQVSQKELSELDTETTTNNALLQAYGYRTQSTNFQAQAGLDRQSADSALVGAGFGAAGTLLGGASSLGGKFGAGPSDQSGL